MNVPTDPTGLPRLDPCGCCEAGVAPPRIDNRPGQPAIAYRVDTHGTALRRMLAGLPTTVRPAEDDGGTESRPLQALTTRAADDPAIAMLDAWATVTDVLTFYQERIANEGFLRTATERLSVLELARAIGYELGPGVAAAAFLTFVVEDAAGAPRRSVVPAGTKVQSIPAQGQLPQTFETEEEIETRAEWNAMRPRRTRPQDIRAGETKVYLKGIATQLQPGDTLLFGGEERMAFPGSERWDVRVVQTVTPVPPDPSEPGAVGHTIVTWDTGLGSVTPAVDPATDPRIYVFRQRAALFGHNAPDWRTMPKDTKTVFDPKWETNGRTQWPDFEITTAAERRIDLDADYPKILAGSWLVLARPGYQECYRVVSVQSASRTDFALTAKTTRIEVDAREHLSWFGLRDTIVFAQSEELARAEEPLDEPVQDRHIVLDRLVSGLTRGRALVVTGRRMRAEVVASGLALRADDGSDREVRLQPGDSLILLAPKLTDETRRVVWRLVDRDGFAGSLTAQAGALVLRPAAP